MCVSYILLRRAETMSLWLQMERRWTDECEGRPEQPHRYLFRLWLVHHKSRIHCLGIRRRTSWLAEGRQPSEDASDSNAAFIVRGICRLDTHEQKIGYGWRNIEARSRNHCCGVIVVSAKYYKFVLQTTLENLYRCTVHCVVYLSNTPTNAHI